LQNFARPFCYYPFRELRACTPETENHPLSGWKRGLVEQKITPVEGKAMVNYVHLLVSISLKYSVLSFMRYLKRKRALIVLGSACELDSGIKVFCVQFGRR